LSLVLQLTQDGGLLKEWNITQPFTAGFPTFYKHQATRPSDSGETVSNLLWRGRRVLTQPSQQVRIKTGRKTQL